MSEIEKTSNMRRIHWIFIILVIGILTVLLSREIVIFWLNLSEFGDIFFKPIYFGLIGGLVLATIALVRVDFKNRRSIAWWFIRLVNKLMRSGGQVENVSMEWFDFEGFRLSPGKFLVWQVTKVLAGTFFFTNIMFGMAVNAVMLGWDSGVSMLPRLFSLPFITPLMDVGYAESVVVPLVPTLTLLVPPILGVLFLRLVLLVAVTHLIRVVLPFFAAYLWGLEKPPLNKVMPTVQVLAIFFLLWFMFSIFFTSFIDYNTRYQILGFGSAAVALVVFVLIDRKRVTLGSHFGFWRRSKMFQIVVLVMIGLSFSSVMVLNNSIADVRKMDMLGPYNSQLISVNRYLAELNNVEESPYEFGLSQIDPGRITNYVAENQELLDKVRLWDQQGSFDKLRPEIGLIPYVDFVEADILRFNETLYWSASMDLILPDTVRSEDRWYASHFVYTHVPSGFLMLDAHNGRIVDAASYFPQRRIYYGEGGLFQDTWIAYPVGRTVSDEIGGHFYEGRGGISISPPMSWIFEPNFLFSYPTTTMHVVRYRDVYDRMSLLFPYFTYQIDGTHVDMWPVTDGEHTYWAMPLVVFLDAGKVPWSGGNPLGRLVGYALIDVYHGDIELMITGDDFFSQLFKRVYSDYVSTEVPEWLKPQLRYPEELIEWRISLYNFYHTTDVATFIAAREFYTVPRGLDTYYIMVQPHGFEKLEFVGLLSLELRGALGENLAGYMVVRNDYPFTGDMIFYKVPVESEAKLLGPTAVNEALDSNPDFAQLKTLLRNPRVGDQIFYRIGDYDVFFLPVYTAPGGGVVTQLGTIACVGADFTGEYYVGLGSNIEESFRAFLAKIAGVEVPPEEPELSEQERIDNLIAVFEDTGLSVLMPTIINPDVSLLEGRVRYVAEEDWGDVQLALNKFLELGEMHDASRVFLWADNGDVNIGLLVRADDILYLHHIIVELT
jgi:uncharacterized protein